MSNEMEAQHGEVGHPQLELDEVESQQLKILFSNIQSDLNSNGQSCSKQAFQSYCDASLDEFLSEKITNLLSIVPSEPEGAVAQITINAFLNFSSTVFKGSFDEKVGIIFSICSTSGSSSAHVDKTISGSSILQYCGSLIQSYKKSCKNRPAAISWLNCLPSDTQTDHLAFYMLQDLFYPFGVPQDLITKRTEDMSTRQFTLDELIVGLSKSMLLQNISNYTFCKCFDFNPEDVGKDLIPNCLKAQPALLSSNFTLLDLDRVLFLNSLLPSPLKSNWRFLFSSATDGESFSKFLSSIQEKGATIIIVRDNYDRVFGGFAPSNWNLGPKFFGTPDSFLFHLDPEMASYSSTGYNENFQYLNMQQKTLPNGLGMGGTLEYFGLWIDSEFGKGFCSPTCTTFSSPQLSFEKEFVITHLEVWGVGPEPKKEEGVREPQSVLDRDPELRAVLELMGRKTNASEGYREIPEPPE